MGPEPVHGRLVRSGGPAKAGTYRLGPAKAGPYRLGPAKAGPYVLLALLIASPAFAQVDLSGSWGATNNEDLAGDSVPVDYTGIPLNPEGRIRALSYNESQYSMIERQCQGLPVFYFVQGPFGLKIWSDTEPVKGTTISYTVGAWENRAPFVIWMDGRPHPSGGQLLIVTTVVEDPRYLQRPYIVSSHFKKEMDGSKWDPSPCMATW